MTRNTKLPAGWKEAELGKVSEITSSKRIYQNEYVNEGILFYRSKEIIELSRGEEPSLELFISEERYKELKKKYGHPQKGDILITAVGTIGVSYVLQDNKDFYFKDGNLLWLRKISSSINPLYLNYFLNYSFRTKKDSMAAGSAYKALTIINLEKLKILMPPIPTQQKIVSILKEIEHTEQLRKQSDELTKDFLKAVFMGMFKDNKHFEKMALGNKNISEEFFAGGDVPKDRLSKTKSEKYNIPIFTNGEKNEGLYGYTNIARVTKPSLTVSARGTIGYSAIRQENFYPAIRLIVITPKKEILNLYYLKYAIDNINFDLSWTSIPQLTVPMLKGYKIPLPPIELQNKFASIVKGVEAMKEQQKHSKEQIDNLLNTSLQKAFTGELVA